MRQHKFETAEVTRKDTARILEMDYFTEDGSLLIRFAQGELDAKNNFVRRGTESTVRLPKGGIPEAVQAALDVLHDHGFEMLVAHGSLPAGAVETAPEVIPDPPEPEPVAEPAPAARTVRTPRRTT
jgi:hypothetical protein